MNDSNLKGFKIESEFYQIPALSLPDPKKETGLESQTILDQDFPNCNFTASETFPTNEQC